MRIQHNILAMNAYRNYNTNTTALGKNLEKLSSGYRINRAGDDAAGLAISEKMRAQITGLSAAQKNVKDGISLVKTAEGAMQEIHDMLNRMDYLATQSANGTYQDPVDRENLQKEVDSLRNEINRIADSSNFNGINLLDGSLDANAEGPVIGDGENRMIQTMIGAGDDPVAQVGLKTMLDGPSSAETKTKFKVDFTNMTAKTGAAAAAAATNGVYKSTITTGGFNAGDTITINGTNYTISATGSTTNTAANLISVDDVNSDTAMATIMAGLITQAGYNVTADGADIVYTAATAGAPASTGVAAITDANKPTVSGGTGTLTFGTINGTDGTDAVAAGTPAAPQVDLKVGGTTLATGVALSDGDNATAIATKVFNALADNTDTQIGGVSYTVTDNGDGTLTFELNDDPTTANVPGNFDWDLNVTAGQISGAHTAGTSVVTPGSVAQAGTVANTVFQVQSSDIKDGATITLDGKTVTLAVGANSKYKDATDAVDLTNMEEASVDLDDALSRISGAFAGGTTNFIVGVNDTSNGDTHAGLTVHKKTTSTETYDTKEKLGAIFSINGPSTSKPLTLQIGDTADDFNQLSVSVGDMHTDAMGTAGGSSIADIDISNQEGAQKAITVIKDAINYVSSIRGDLGATQNRLEHTANNLSVMAENIQDAESTIRDTDVAEEMMAYTKNNILVQAAQAMLAQANAVPQGVLQLLQ